MPQVNKSESCGAVVVGNELHVFFSVVSRVDGICLRSVSGNSESSALDDSLFV